MNLCTRRNILGRACGLTSTVLVATTLDAPAITQEESGASKTNRPLKVVVTGGHPGDPEYGCGGTIARYTDLGHEVVLLYLNRGEWPPRD